MLAEMANGEIKRWVDMVAEAEEEADMVEEVDGVAEEDGEVEVEVIEILLTVS